MNKYYDGTKLLSLRDINGEKPEIYICTSNRTGGKTTYFNRLVVNRFLNKNQKFCLLYRFKYELESIADKFFKDIKELFFKDYSMKQATKGNGNYIELFLCKGENIIPCGYAIALNCADQIKKFSHLFNDVDCILFDEFQSETNHYCASEIDKFISIHTSIARGQGKQYRYVPVYMLSNPVTLLNPYYVALNISNRIKKDTKFLKGNGFVLEQGFIKNASTEQLNSGFNKAFSKHEYVAYSAQNIYLHDSHSFIEKIKGNFRYLCTIKYKSNNYAIKEFSEIGVVYCDNRPDLKNPNRISVTINDHDINYVMLKQNQLFINTLRYYFDNGCFRFKDLNCKEAILQLLSY